MPSTNLFTPLTLGRLSLSHRVVMPPLTRMRAEHGNVANALMAQYYAQRATPGGFIIGEASQISPDGRGLPCTPGIHTPEQIAGWKLVVDAVHAKGGSIFLQLWHMGRLSHPSHLDGALPMAPSAIAAQGEGLTADYKRVPFLTPRALETGEMPALVERYAQAARNAMAAGFDGVEIHAANGYLFDQFRCPYLNDRADAYGGATHKRWRFLLETTAAVAETIGSERVGVRISPLGTAHEMQPDPAPLFTYGYLACQLDQLGISYLHVYDQSGNWIHDPQSDLLQHLRACYSGTMILCGGFDRERAEAALRNDCGDLIAFGKHFIANPDLVERLRIGAPLAHWNASTIYKGGAQGYIDYPTLQEKAHSEH